MADDVAVASVKIEGIETFGTVERVDVEDDDRLIDKATVVFDDVDGVAAMVAIEQKAVKIELGWSGEKALVFEGLVWKSKTETAGGGKQRVTIEALDLSYKMNQGEGKAKTYAPGKLSDILKTIVGEHKIEVGQIQLFEDPTFTAEEPLTKGPKTDWMFIQELAERYHARAFVEVNDDKSKFYFVSETFLLTGAPQGMLHHCPGRSELIEFKYERIGSAAAPVRSAAVVDPKTGEPVLKQGEAPQPEKPLTVDPDAKSVLDQKRAGAGAVLSGAVEAVSKSEGKVEDARAKQNVAGLPGDGQSAEGEIKQDPTRVLGLRGEGTAVGTVKMRAKGKVTIEGIATWAAGDWYVRRVNHVFTRVTALDRNRKPEDRSTYRTRFLVTR
ncbi:hypothetical protein [Sorangium sp. So ce1000]|uniref:hypothetical protein n=1 Tax=Sorangium sp. So ce1000 TaxID=3133325 RepID=UPI003F634934